MNEDIDSKPRSKSRQCFKYLVWQPMKHSHICPDHKALYLNLDQIATYVNSCINGVVCS